MRVFGFFLSALLSFTITNARADVLPLPWGKRPPRPIEHRNQPVPKSSDLPTGPQTTSTATRVSMTAAQVQVNIEKMPAPAASESKKLHLVAHVTGEFELACSTVTSENNNLTLAFPLGYEGDILPKPLNFTATLDGKAVEDLKTATWPILDGSPKPRTQWGYTWQLLGLCRGQKNRVIVKYSLILPEHQGKADFTYFLRSGAFWDGPIGQEIVTVVVDPGLQTEIISPVHLKPAKRADTFLRWQITNTKPTEDIRLVLSPVAQP